MYLIALCDDEAAELDKTGKLLSDYEKEHPGLDFVIDHFENADELLYLINEENYAPDLIFLDICMPGRTGIEVAQELRGIEYEGEIIFLTKSREYALEAFGVDAAQYLVKPVSDSRLFSVLEKFLESVEEARKKYILLRVDGKLVRVSLNDIVYCEAQGKTQRLHLVNGEQYLLRMTMAEIYGMVSGYQEFARIGVGFIVNLGYINSMNAREINMDNGKKIYLPRGTYKGLRERYFSYYCPEME